MTTEQFALIGLSTLSGVMGWLLREVWGAVKSLRSDLDDLRVSIAETYIRRDSLRDALEPLREQLSRIEGALTHKVDKP
jgi:hypothetical protein